MDLILVPKFLKTFNKYKITILCLKKPLKSKVSHNKKINILDFYLCLDSKASLFSSSEKNINLKWNTEENITIWIGKTNIILKYLILTKFYWYRVVWLSGSVLVSGAAAYKIESAPSTTFEFSPLTVLWRAR